MRGIRRGVAAALLAVASAAGAGAQQLDPPPPPADSGTTVRVTPGAQYGAGPLRRFLVGHNHRDLWVRQLEVPLLDLNTFAGGLRPVEQGGNQSKTLHMVTPEGRTFIFRSVNKYMGQVFPEDFRGTLTERLAQDHVSAFHPGGAFMVPRLHEALGQLAVPPVYRVMPDDPRLGEYRETFAGMLGTVVERPDEGERGEALFAGSHRIVGTEEIFDKLEDSPRDRVAAEEFLAARLVDFLVGDTDRGPDQWRWARVPVEHGFRWRPIIRDRDWAFMTADGVLPSIIRRFYQKLVTFDDELPSVGRLTWADAGMGRRLLSGLDAAAWDSVVTEVGRRLTDEVIAEAVDRLPPEQKPGHAEALQARLEARRAELPAAAEAWYALLATDVDVQGTDLPDRAEIARGPGGAVTVTLYGPAAVMVPVVDGSSDDEEAAEHAADPYYDRDFPSLPDSVTGWLPYYRRVFRPHETEEVRVYLQGGDDVAVVRGEGDAGIVIRVIGGGGEDALHDETPTGRGVVLYDEEGDYEPEEDEADFLLDKIGADRARDWGSDHSWFQPALDYREGAGVILGGGPVWTDYRFRSHPFGTRVAVKGLVSTWTGRLGVQATAETRLPASPWYVRLRGRATRFEGIRFYGYGNDTPPLDEDVSLIRQDQALVELLFGSGRSWWSVRGGPILRYTAPEVPAANPAAGAELFGTDDLLEAGAVVAARLTRVDDRSTPTRGVRLSVEAQGFPAPGTDAGPYSRVESVAQGFLPLVGGTVAAVRAGGRAARGDFPLHSAAAIGGLSSLRGYRWQRFSGDAAAYGGIDLRVPLFRANLLVVRGRINALGLVDAGRVWLDGESSGGWHTGHGAGLLIEALDTSVYGLWARGEEDRLYVGLGTPY